VLLSLLIVGAVGWIGSERGMHPERKVEDHALCEYPFVQSTAEVRFESLDGTPLAGWFIPGRPKGPTIILLHGYGRSRAELLPHTNYLHQAGYNVLLFDFRNRGKAAERRSPSAPGNLWTCGVRSRTSSPAPMSTPGASRSRA